MNILGEFKRVWSMDSVARKLCPAERVFTGQAPNSYQDDNGQTVEVNPPFVSIRFVDGVPDGGTTLNQFQVHTIQVSAYSNKRAEAEKIRDHAADLFEDCLLKLGGSTRQFQDCSLDIPGELPAEDGLYELFQRFRVEVTISRPIRKGL